MPSKCLTRFTLVAGEVGLTVTAEGRWKVDTRPRIQAWIAVAEDL